MQLCGKSLFSVAYPPLISEDKVTSICTNYTMCGHIKILSGVEWQELNNSEPSFFSLVFLKTFFWNVIDRYCVKTWGKVAVRNLNA